MPCTRRREQVLADPSVFNEVFLPGFHLIPEPTYKYGLLRRCLTLASTIAAVCQLCALPSSQPVRIGLITMSIPPPRSIPISIELNARETGKFLAPVKALPIGHPHAPIAVGWRERQDLNLRALRPPAFKAGAIDQLCHVHTWPKVGLEPTTYRLQGDCAAITLFRHTARLQSHRGKVHPCKTGGHPRPSHAGSEAWLIAMRKECQ